MSEYSPLPGTVRSYDDRAEFEEPCTRNRSGSGGSPALGAPTRLRQRLSATSPFLAQYSALQIAPSLACIAPAAEICACAVKADTTPAPTPRLAPLRMARRARAWSAELSVMVSSEFSARSRRRSHSRAGSWVGMRPYQIAKDGQGGRRLAEPQSQNRTNLSQRKPSRACARFASRCRPSARNARSGGRRGVGLDIGRCNDDMGGAGSCRDVA